MKENNRQPSEEGLKENNKENLNTKQGTTINHEDIKIGISEEFRLNKSRKNDV